MEESKIYIVLNATRFKELCEEKLGDEITADNYIEMEKFRNEKISLVPQNIPNKYYINLDVPRYNIFVNIQDKWKLNNIINLTDDDIEELLDDDAIEDIETYRHWKETLAFKVTDKETFYNDILPSLTDEEAISVLKRLYQRNRGNVEYNFYLVYDEDRCHIYIHDSKFNTSYKIPYTTLDKEQLTNLIKEESVETISCKINEETDYINFEDNISNIRRVNGFSHGIRIYKINDRYVIRDTLREDYYKRYSMSVSGSTERETIHKYREVLTSNLLNKRLFEHKDVARTMDMYKHVIEDKEY